MRNRRRNDGQHSASTGPSSGGSVSDQSATAFLTTRIGHLMQRMVSGNQP